MRKLFISLIFIMFICISQAQVYVPLNTTYSSWYFTSPVYASSSFTHYKYDNTSYIIRMVFSPYGTNDYIYEYYNLAGVPVRSVFLYGRLSGSKDMGNYIKIGNDYYFSYSFSFGSGYYGCGILRADFSNDVINDCLVEPYCSYKTYSTRPFHSVGMPITKKPNIPATLNNSLTAICGEYLCYDFYDPYTNTTSSPRCFDWTTGINTLDVAFISPARECFYFSDCSFHIIYRGDLTYYRTGDIALYVREIRFTLWGYDFYDKCIAGLTTSRADCEINYIPADYVVYSPEFPNKIYFRSIHYGAYKVYGTLIVDNKYNVISIQSLNTIGNAMVPNAVVIPCSLRPNINIMDCYVKYNLTDDLSRKTNELYILFADYHTNSRAFIFNIGVCGNGCKNITETLTFGFGYGVHVFKIPIYDIKSVSYDVNLTIVIPYYPPNIKDISIDVLPLDGYPTARLFKWQIFRFNDGEGFSVVSRFYNAFQFPLEYVECTLWRSVGCYNTTHEKFVRDCRPPGYLETVMYVYNASCTIIQPPTIPPGPWPPGVPYNYTWNFSEIFERYNITGPAVVGLYGLSMLLTPIGVAVLITIIIGIIAGKYGGPQIGILSAVMLLVLFTVMGFLPVWILVILILVAGLLFAYLIGGIFK